MGIQRFSKNWIQQFQQEKMKKNYNFFFHQTYLLVRKLDKSIRKWVATNNTQYTNTNTSIQQELESTLLH